MSLKPEWQDMFFADNEVKSSSIILGEIRLVVYRHASKSIEWYTHCVLFNEQLDVKTMSFAKAKAVTKLQLKLDVALIAIMRI